MKVFNLTDVETKKLTQFHAVGQTYEIMGSTIPPGGSATFDDALRAVVRRQCDHLSRIGALAVDEPPKDYLNAKAAAAPVATKPSTPAAAPAAPAAVPADPPAVPAPATAPAPAAPAEASTAEETPKARKKV